jgi:UvrD-like helicase family protein
MSAVELMTIVGAKGLSADHVIIIGFDNVNMSWVTRNAFFVAKTRARKSLHLITALKAGGAAGPHGFLDHLPDAHLEFSRYTKGDLTKKSCGGRAGFLRYLANLAAQPPQSEADELLMRARTGFLGEPLVNPLMGKVAPSVLETIGSLQNTVRKEYAC